jgi:hypothetical protein
MLRWIQGYPALAKPLVESIEQSFKALDRVPYSIEQAIPFIYLFFSNATVVSQIQAWAAAKPPLIERLIAEDYMRNLEALRDARFGCLMKQDELPVVYRRTLLPFDAWMLTGQELSIQHLIGQKALSASMFITAD